MCVQLLFNKGTVSLISQVAAKFQRQGWALLRMSDLRTAPVLQWQLILFL